jgi:8-amino-7-oxononanoate synthase
VGMGCRFPKADDAEQYWRNIARGHTAFRNVPGDRWKHEVFYHSSQREVDKTWAPKGSFIDDIKSFAALHYGIAPRRLEVMDPQQRLLIEATRVALQDAGYEAKPFDRSRTGVYVGLSISEFKNIAESRITAMQIAAGEFGAAAGSQALRDALMEMVEGIVPTRAFSLAGSLTALNAAAISQTFDFGGPSFTIDAACASASVAINDAILNLRAGLIDSAIAGGAYLNLTPINLVAFTRIGAISPSGACRPFDARADGFVQSDGVGVLMLKRLDDAIADGDRIRAVVVGTGCNNDGRGEGPMTPRVEGQLAVLAAAYRDAGVSPATVAYFEAHGTATAVGDPVEVEALGTLLRDAGVAREAPVHVGSVKGNIGHAMSAAGIAGVIKVVKMLEHRVAPPQAGYETPNPILGLDRWPLLVSKTAEPLHPRDGAPLRAAVSSFGFGGTNSHLILEAPPQIDRRKTIAFSTLGTGLRALSAEQVRLRATGGDPIPPDGPEAVLVTAPNLPLLGAHAGALVERVEDLSLADVAYTLNARRKKERMRAVISARTTEELVESLRTLSKAASDARGDVRFPIVVKPGLVIHDAGIEEKAPKIAFLFPGQGAQRANALVQLLRRFPRFRARLEALEASVGDLLPKPLLEYLFPTNGDLHREEAALTATEVCQPAMVALGIAVASLLDDANVKASVSLGHSLGEFAALAHAGVLTWDDAMRFAALRGRAMRDLGLRDPGTMAAVLAPVAEVKAAIEGIDGVQVANVNHPRQVSISGTTEGIEHAKRTLLAQGFDVRPLQVSHAFHSPLLSGIRREVDRAAASLSIGRPKHVAASSIGEAPYGEDVARTRTLIAEHASSPVDFVRGLEQAFAAGATVFVQAGAGSTLASFARATLSDRVQVVTLAPMDDDGGLELIRGTATLAALGVPVDFEVLYEGEGRRVVELPETPLERQTYWVAKPKQQRAVLDFPLPDKNDGRPIVNIQGDAMATNDRPANDALVQLLAEQAAILRSHAEIIAQQNRLLLGDNVPPDHRPQASGTALPPAIVTAPPKPEASSMEKMSKVAAIIEEPPPPAVNAGEVRARVFELVARISAFPKETLRGEQRLVDELGFDSLMVADLGGAIENAYPNLGGLPQSLFSLTTTVAEIADHVAKHVAAGTGTQTRSAKAAEPHTENLEPVLRYRVLARPRTRAAVSAHDPKNETWLITEDGSDLGAELGAILAAKGARVVRVRFSRDGVAAADRLRATKLNLWPESFPEGLVEALARGEMKVDGFVHLTGLQAKEGDDPKSPIVLLHPLASKLDVPRVFAVTGLGGRLGLERSPALQKHLVQSTLLGYVKALARERPNAVVRAIDVDPSISSKTNAAWLFDELMSGDRLVEVGFDGAERYAAELAVVPGREKDPKQKPRIEKSDVVLLTGGTGEIGASIARVIAAMKPKGVVLVGRRAPDDKANQLIDELQRLGTKALYVSADVANEKALKTACAAATEALGQITVAIHAAGVIEDAPVAKKTVESIARVMGAKASGAQALLRAFPMLRELVLFSSWAGRFGNAHQADYAAANELIDHLAVANTDPRIRVVSIVWPPWSSTKMVRSIPSMIQNAMKSEGVTFLGDAEGMRVFEAIFAEAAQGIEVVGRALPRSTSRVVHEERFDIARHPYLNDHRLKDRGVVPLAGAADLAVFTAFGGKAPSGIFAIENLELVRGLYDGDRAIVRADKRALIPGSSEAKIEVKVDESIAYRAVVRSQERETLGASAIALEGEDEAASLDLDAFYRHHTFHGPMLRGIVRVERMTKNGISGVVRTSKPKSWMPETNRESWTVDPLVLDGSFQLAGYWGALHGKGLGYPSGFDRLVIVRPFGSGSIRATLSMSSIDAEGFSASIAFEDEDGICALMTGLRGRFFEIGSTARPEVPEENWRIAAFPEVEALDQRFQMAELIGLRNPYFHMHSGTARNTSVVDGVEMINFSSYNYLGFSGHPEVLAAAKEAIDRYGTSVSASRIASGERPIHRQLEEGIARHVGVEDSIVFVSGHATNVTTVGHLFDEHDLIVHDSLIHDSIMQGVHLSGATRRPFPHGDVDALERILEAVRTNYRRVLVAAEGIYSMDGDACDLPRLIDLKKRYRALLLIDEAHSIGVLGPSGRGVGHHFPGVDPNDVDLWMGTLSKSFASCGGYIAGSKALVRYLKYTAPGFVYSAGITPPNAASALKALELMHRHPEVVERLRQRSKLFLDLARQKGINTGLAIGAAVVPAIVGNSLDCMRLSEALAARRINVQPIVYPAVEDDSARLRFFLSATHTEDEIRHAVNVLAEELEKIRAAAAQTEGNVRA